MDLQYFIDTLHEELDARVVSAALGPEGTLHLRVEYDDLILPAGKRAVTLSCTEPKEFYASPGFVGSIAYCQEHPLLLDHSGPQADLFFWSAPSLPSEVFYIAHKVLVSEFRGWRSPSKYLNGQPEEFRAHLAGGYGLLARGPLEPLRAVADALSAILVVKVVASHNLPNTSSVLTLGDRFVVCQSVEVSENDG